MKHQNRDVYVKTPTFYPMSFFLVSPGLYLYWSIKIFRPSKLLLIYQHYLAIIQIVGWRHAVELQRTVEDFFWQSLEVYHSNFVMLKALVPARSQKLSNFELVQYFDEWLFGKNRYRSNLKQECQPKLCIYLTSRMWHKINF